VSFFKFVVSTIAGHVAWIKGIASLLVRSFHCSSATIDGSRGASCACT